MKFVAPQTMSATIIMYGLSHLLWQLLVHSSRFKSNVDVEENYHREIKSPVLKGSAGNALTGKGRLHCSQHLRKQPQPEEIYYLCILYLCILYLCICDLLFLYLYFCICSLLSTLRKQTQSEKIKNLCILHFCILYLCICVSVFMYLCVFICVFVFVHLCTALNI